jgi:NTP pyrophosphatase (non-canonical NTP hydrolase)
MATNIQDLIENVLQWGEQKGITGPEGRGTLLGQLSKTQEELTETRDAAVLYEYSLLRRPPHPPLDDLKDGIGDCAVTLILAAEMAGLRFEDCLQAAYDEIKGRTGKMVDGVFIKDIPAIPKDSSDDDLDEPLGFPQGNCDGEVCESCQ